eukprot:scpid100713/ scgid0662/ 
MSAKCFGGSCAKIKLYDTDPPDSTPFYSFLQLTPKWTLQQQRQQQNLMMAQHIAAVQQQQQQYHCQLVHQQLQLYSSFRETMFLLIAQYVYRYLVLFLESGFFYYGCACECVSERGRVCVCLHVCVRTCMCMGERDLENDCVCVGARVSVGVPVCVCERRRECGCVRVCVQE